MTDGLTLFFSWGGLNMAQELREKASPVALACALLEDNNRALFLVRRGQNGGEAIELPCALVFPGEDPAGLAVGALREKAGIDAHSPGVAFEARHNAGSRKHKHLVPVLVFKMVAKDRTARPSSEFSGFRWVPLAEAKKTRLGRNAEWLNSI